MRSNLVAWLMFDYRFLFSFLLFFTSMLMLCGATFVFKGYYLVPNEFSSFIFLFCLASSRFRSRSISMTEGILFLARGLKCHIEWLVTWWKFVYINFYKMWNIWAVIVTKEKKKNEKSKWTNENAFGSVFGFSYFSSAYHCCLTKLVMCFWHKCFNVASWKHKLFGNLDTKS